MQRGLNPGDLFVTASKFKTPFSGYIGIVIARYDNFGTKYHILSPDNIRWLTEFVFIGCYDKVET